MTSWTDSTMLVRLTIRTWSARAKDNNASALVATTEGVSSSVGRYNKTLMEDDLVRDPQRCGTILRSEFNKVSLPWGGGGTRIMTPKAYMDFIPTFRSRCADFDLLADKLVREYPRLIAEAQLRLKGLFDPNDYPDVSTLRGKYSIEFVPMAVPTENDFRISLPAELMAEAKAELRAELERTKAGAAAELINRMYQRVITVAETLADQTKVFRDSLVENIDTTYDDVVALDFTDDPEVAAVLAEMHSLCGLNPALLRSDNMNPNGYRATTAKRARQVVNFIESITRK